MIVVLFAAILQLVLTYQVLFGDVPIFMCWY